MKGTDTPLNASEITQLIRDEIQKKEKRPTDVIPARLDLKTRICLMAAIILGTSDHERMNTKLAVEAAVEIENATDARVRKMKQDNPIPRGRNRTENGE